MSANNTSSSRLSVALGVFGALAGFAVVTVLFQWSAGGKPIDPSVAERLKKKETVAGEQAALIEKYGMESSAKADAVFGKVGDQLKARKVAASSVVVPGSPTAIKQAPVAAPAPPAPTPSSAPVAPTK